MSTGGSSIGWTPGVSVRGGVAHMRRVVESRNFVSFVLSAAIGLYLFRSWPFPVANNVLRMALLQKPYLFYANKYAFTAMLFTTPYIILSVQAYALAYGIASLLNNLFGRGKEPIWQQAYTNLVKFIILLHKFVYNYVTLFEIYECAINPHKLELRIAEGEQLFGTANYVLLDDAVYVAHVELARFLWARVEGTNWMRAPASEELKGVLKAKRILYDIQTESGLPADSRDAKEEDRRQRFEAVKRWFNDDWRRAPPRPYSGCVGRPAFIDSSDGLLA